jgi:phospholipid-binding lipoprotein MlaA
MPFRRWIASGALAAATLAGCTVPDEPVEVFDPYEGTNRQIHAFNKGLDSVVWRPTSTAYGTVLPAPVRSGVSNFAANLDTPRHVVNDVLQGDIGDAGHNTMRFLFNTAFGIGGLFDIATGAGIEARPTGFGETLHSWGSEEGAFIELPVFGPSNERDAVGQAVDLVSNPLLLVIPADSQWVPTASNLVDRVGDRYEFRESIDGVLYNSADSYAQTRNLYLQNRRFVLGEDEEEFFFDPYEDLFDE